MTADEPRPTCYTGGNRSTWFAVTSSIKGLAQIRVDGGYPGTLRTMALYTGSTMADLIQRACDSSQPTILEALTSLRAGSVVYAQVIADGPFTIRATMYPTPMIDSFADAEELTMGYTSNGVWTSEGGTVEAHEPLQCGGARTSWLRFVPPRSTTVTFMTLSSPNDVLGVYRGSALTDLQLLGCGTTNSYQVAGTLTTAFETRLTTVVERGATYYVQVGVRAGNGGVVVLSVSDRGPVPNDAPESAAPLGEDVTQLGTTMGAFTTPLSATCPYSFGTVWYLITPRAAGTLHVTMVSMPSAAHRNFNFAPAIAIHRADTRELLTCAQDTAAFVEQAAVVEAGRSYLIAAMSAGWPGEYRLHWAVR